MVDSLALGVQTLLKLRLDATPRLFALQAEVALANCDKIGDLGQGDLADSRDVASGLRFFRSSILVLLQSQEVLEIVALHLEKGLDGVECLAELDHRPGYVCIFL